MRLKQHEWSKLASRQLPMATSFSLIADCLVAAALDASTHAKGW